MNLNAFFTNDPAEKPLDQMAVDGGYCGILGEVGLIGDSLDSGEMEVFNATGRHCIDMPEYSWIQYFAKMTGNKVYAFTRGGMTAKEYMEGYAEFYNYFDRKKACKAYIITLAVNDMNQMMAGNLEFGSIDDIDFEDYHNNKKTYCGYYGAILQRYRQISPKCRLFLVTTFYNWKEPKQVELMEKQRQFIYELSQRMEFTYVMDLMQYGPVQDEDFEKKFYMNGHMTPLGYMLKAKMYASYIDYIIRHNLEDFAQLHMLDEWEHDDKYKW